MSKTYLRLVCQNDDPIRPGKPIPEVFRGNMPVKLSGHYTILGGAFVDAQARRGETPDELEGMVGVVQTHKRMRFVNRTSGVVMKFDA